LIWKIPVLSATVKSTERWSFRRSEEASTSRWASSARSRSGVTVSRLPCGPVAGEVPGESADADPEEALPAGGAARGPGHLSRRPTASPSARRSAPRCGGSRP
jgi:hypothetical protein